MKIRFKYQKKFQIYSLDEIDPTVKQLIQGAADKFDLNANNVEISLNANDYYNVENNGFQKASDLKIVNGDIIHVRLNGIYDDIKNIIKREISNKLEDVLAYSNICYNSPLLMKLLIPIHLFMSETGFSAPNSDKPFIESIFNTAAYSNFNVEPPKLIRLIYNYLSDNSFSINLTIQHFEPYVCVYGSYCQSKNIHSFNFKSKDFILQNPARNPMNKSDLVYKNLSQFSTSFKNSIAVPLRIDIHLNHYIPTHGFLQVLPYEILHKIFEYLDLKSIVLVMTSCHRLNEAGRFCSKIWLKRLMKLSGKNINDLETDNPTDEREPDFYYKKYLLCVKERKLKRKAGIGASREFEELYHL